MMKHSSTFHRGPGGALACALVLQSVGFGFNTAEDGQGYELLGEIAPMKSTICFLFGILPVLYLGHSLYKDLFFVIV